MATDIQKKIAQNRALLVTDPDNIKYLCGFGGSSGIAIVTRKSMFLLTDFRYSGAVKHLSPGIRAVITTDAISETLNILKKSKIKTLLFEEENVTVGRYKRLKNKLTGIKLVGSSGLIETARAVKTSVEISLIKKAQTINEKTLKTIRREIKPGITEKSLARKIVETATKLGSDGPAFPPIVAFGKNSASPHHEPGFAKLKKGDLVLLDMGFKYKGYCSDMTRVFFTAPPTPLQKTVYSTVLKAQTEAVKHLKGGSRGDTIDRLARNIIKKAGYNDMFGHSLGHGVGIAVHELPYLSTKYRKTVPVNAVVTVEPGIYIENSFGIRIEDMVLVGRDKTTTITKIPKKITDPFLSIF